MMIWLLSSSIIRRKQFANLIFNKAIKDIMQKGLKFQRQPHSTTRMTRPKVAACATDYSSSYPNLLLGYGAAYQLITSALAYWAVFNWTPGLFHSLLRNSQANSSLALGTKEACNILHLLTMVVKQDMLQVLIVRIASKRLESADMLVRPLILWMKNRMNESSLSYLNSFKMNRLLTFLASLLKHPCGKTSLLKAGATGALTSTLKRYNNMYDMDGKFVENRPNTDVALVHSWGFPVFESLALIFESSTSVQYSLKYDKYSSNELSIEVCTAIGCQLLKSFQALIEEAEEKRRLEG